MSVVAEQQVQVANELDSEFEWGAERAHRAVFAQNLLTALPLMFADIAGLATACCLAMLAEAALGYGLGLGVIAVGLVGTWPTFLVSYFLCGLYPGVGLKPASEFRHTAAATTIVLTGLVSASIIGLSFGRDHISISAYLVLWLAAIAVVPSYRCIARSVCAKYEWWLQPVLIVGGADSNRAIVDAIRCEPEAGLRLVGVVCDSDSASDHGSLEGPALGHGDFAKLTRRLAAHRAIVSSDSPHLNDVCAPGVGVPYVHVVSAGSGANVPTLWSAMGECAGLPEIQVKDCLLLPTSRCMKRCLDLLAILLATPLLIPLFAVLCVLVKASSAGPAFYCQRRLGRGGRYFYVWKFRTMVAHADQVLQRFLEENPALRVEWERDHKLKDDPRITPIGAFLRKSSLDELPQLWNVFVGDMSLVGPRPIVDAEIAKYGPVYELYKQVRPGITGIWQVSGRNNTTYEERLKFDRYYVQNWSPCLDAFILLRTVRTVIMREGAY